MPVKNKPASEQVRQEICSLLSNGTKAETNLLSELLRKSIQGVIQEAL